MSKLFKNKKFVGFLIVVVVVAGLIIYNNLKPTAITTHKEKYEGTDLTVDTGELSRKNTYSKYLQEHADAASPTDVIDVDVFKFTKNSKNATVENSVGDEGSKAVTSAEDGALEYKVNVPTEGFYNIYVEYYPTQSRGISIEREVKINGVMPFNGADAVSFSRVWTDATEVTSDNQGNEIRPTQKETPIWQSSYFKDETGYVNEPYKFYFKKGENTITLTGVNEPFTIRKLTIGNKKADVAYADYEKTVDTTKYKEDDSQDAIIVEGEDSVRRSSPSLYSIYDRTSNDTQPYSSGKTKLNMTGGKQWRVAGDWIEWDITVPKDGLYTIGLKARQGYNRGIVATRSVMIDGEVPFAELNKVTFDYNSYWSMRVLGDEDGNAYKIPLTAGTHTIRIECTLGDMGELLTNLSDSVYRLNKMYQKILVLTGTEPDTYRDYHVEQYYPEVIEAMQVEAKRLYKLVDDVMEYSGGNNQYIAVAQTIASQLESFYDRPDKIPSKLSNFKENVSSLGTSINTLSESSLDIDYIAIAPSESKLPKVTENGLDKVVHETTSFFDSFFNDYTALGNVYEDSAKTLNVWILSGRDQSTILKTMIDDTFTPESGINVNVKLVDATTLLPAVVAGTGPDVALTVMQSEPVNFALRNASVDLTQFSDLNDVLNEYYESAYESYKFNGGIYAIPETQNYNVMFYRTDICSELGIEVPKTWDEMLSILPVLQKNNMQIAIPSVERKIGNTTNPDLANYYAQLYQRGGRLYTDDAKISTIDTENAINAFEFYTKLFTNYKLEKQYDFNNRFRSGEMPIGVADYSNFNTLAVFAPEIKGLWKFDLIPGVEQEDGTINRSVQSWGQCSMMLRTAKNKDDAWTFMKWWANSTTQVRFGQELESVMGASARYATANKNTFDQLSWSSKDASVLKEQWKWAFGLPEVAGGYYTARHITNAVRKVIINNEDPRETLLDYTRTINEELTKKRKEFGLPVDEDTTDISTSSEEGE